VRLNFFKYHWIFCNLRVVVLRLIYGARPCVEYFFRLFSGFGVDIGAYISCNGAKLLFGFGPGRIFHNRPICRRGILRNIGQVSVG
jgi:hypothetical protein